MQSEQVLIILGFKITYIEAIILGLLTLTIIGLFLSLIPWKKLAYNWVGVKTTEARILLQYGEMVFPVDGKYYASVSLKDLTEAEYEILASGQPDDSLKQNIREAQDEEWLVYHYKVNGRKADLFVPEKHPWRFAAYTGQRILEVTAGHLMPQGADNEIGEYKISAMTQALEQIEMLKSLHGAKAMNWVLAAIVGLAIGAGAIILFQNFGAKEAATPQPGGAPGQQAPSGTQPQSGPVSWRLLGVD